MICPHCGNQMRLVRCDPFGEWERCKACDCEALKPVARPTSLRQASSSARKLAETVTEHTLALIVQALGQVPQTGAELRRGAAWLAVRRKKQ